MSRLNETQRRRLSFVCLVVAASVLGGAGPSLADQKNAPGVYPSKLSTVGRIKGKPMALQPSAILQLEVLEGIKRAKTAVQKKIDSRYFLGLLHQRKDPRLAPLTAFRFVRPAADGKVAVEVVVHGVAAVRRAARKVRAIGELTASVRPESGRILGRLRLQDLETVAALPGVRKVRQPIPAVTRKVDTTEGDVTHGVEEARNYFGADGAGVKVCVLADGVDSLADEQASGDLPAEVDVLSGQEGAGDEGTAMLEIIHDLAPAATLGFATATTDAQTFIDNISGLASDGCDIIVDDTLYIDESPFQDGPIAQAVQAAVDGGVLFFSAAGNEGNRDSSGSNTWEGDFNANGEIAALAGIGEANDFGDGGQSILVNDADFDPVILLWAEHYTFAAGVASTDFDIYDLSADLSDVFDGAFDTQDGVGGDDFPIEFMAGGALSGERLAILRYAAGSTSSVPMIHMTMVHAPGNFLDDGALDQDLATGGGLWGHPGVAGVFAVAATPAAAAFASSTEDGPFPDLFTGANEVEVFSSDGPRRILLTAAGTEITPGNRTSTGGVVRQKPDLSAADGVQAGGSRLYGTSAAAAHAAGIAALIRSEVPASTPAQVRTALTSSAIDIGVAGVDRSSGAGIAMAHAALAAAGATPQAFLATETPELTELAGDGDAIVEPNEDWAMKVPLVNNGGAAAMVVSATLATGVTGLDVYTAAAGYADIAAGEDEVGFGAFTFHVGAEISCGATLTFDLKATYTGGTSPQDLQVQLVAGGAGTPVCDAPVQPAVVGGTKTIGGIIQPGGTITYAVTLTNVGPGVHAQDNPGNEFTDVLPASLTLVSATAGVGTAVAAIGTNTVTWNGTVGTVNDSVTISISATIHNGTGGQTITNQGTIAYDSDRDGTNDAVAVTDDPGVGGAADPTAFVVIALESTTTLASSPNPSSLGEAVLLTATVTAGATGEVEFFDGATSLGSSSLASGTATRSVDTLTLGDHTLTAVYKTDGTYAGSTSNAVVQTVESGATTTTLTSNNNPSELGEPVTFTATLSDPAATGNVTFRDGSTVLGTNTINGGTARRTVSSLEAGDHDLTATYNGDATHDPSTSSVLVQVVDKATTTITVTSSLNPSTTGAAVSFTAKVTPAAAGGTVSFKDGATTLGTAELAGGMAVLSVSTLAAGAHDITAVYPGNSDYTAATSAVLVQTVEETVLTPSTIELVAAPNPATFGGPVVLTATVTPAAATGSVTFKDGETELATVTLEGGIAMFTTSDRGGGTHSLTATYGGDAQTASSSSPAVSLTVNAAASTTALTTTAESPLDPGETVTLTVAVTSAAGTPGGSVKLFDGATELDDATLTGGAATFSVTLTAAGAHALTVTYQGDGDFAASTSAVLTLTVAGAGTPDAGTPPIDAAPPIDARLPDAATPAADARLPDAAPPAADARVSASPDARVVTEDSSSGCGCVVGASSTPTRDGGPIGAGILGLAGLVGLVVRRRRR